MNKAELLQAIQDKGWQILRTTEQSTLGNITWYVSNVFKAQDGAAIRQNVGFYVADENQPTEAAYWQQRELEPEPAPPGIQQQLANWLNGKVEDGTIEGYVIQNVMPNVERAVVTIYVRNPSNELIPKVALLYRDAEDALAYDFITAS
jgi:hypothetical protein